MITIPSEYFLFYFPIFIAINAKLFTGNSYLKPNKNISNTINCKIILEIAEIY